MYPDSDPLNPSRVVYPSKMDEQLSATLKDHFRTFMRHELRTPLNAMLGYAELLREELGDRSLGDGAELAASLDAIATNARQVLTVIGDLLDPARVAGEDHTIDGLGIEEAVARLRLMVRRPLDTVLSHAELWLGRIDERPELEFLRDLESIHRGALDLHKNLDDILHLQRMRAGVLERRALKRTRTELRMVAADASRTGSVMRSSLEGRILVVDDVPANRDILCRRLERLGHEVVSVVSGAAALEALGASAYDLVLLDLVMPDMSGFTVLQRLRAEAATRDVPVIIISAMDALDSMARCIAEGAEDVLSKPIDLVLLRARVAASIEKKRLRDRELAYLNAVERVTEAARELEANRFQPQALTDLAGRNDALGSLARVFITMADEVRRREEQLAAQVRELRVVIDQRQVAEQVEQITDSDFFRDLKARARRMSRKPTAGGNGSEK